MGIDADAPAMPTGGPANGLAATTEVVGVALEVSPLLSVRSPR